MIQINAEPLKVFVLAGQSNMVGKRGDALALPQEMKGVQQNLFFKKSAWVPLAPGVSEKRGFGPEISFAYAMGEYLGEPVGIIKHSSGGTSLAKRWDPSAEKSLYQMLLNKVKDAQKSRDIEILGMLWMQGEADSKNQQDAEAYAENFKNFIYTAREDFGSPEMIFIAGRVNPTAEKYPFVDIVRAAQENCAVDNYSFIDCDGLSKVSDQVHYDPVGLVEMGKLFARAMKGHL